MKNTIVTVILLFVLSVGAFAQKGVVGLGSNLSYNTDYELTGLGMKCQYGLTDRLRISPQFSYFFEYYYTNVCSFDFDFHYFFPFGQDVEVYPIMGMNFSRLQIAGVVDSGLGLNGGIGLQFPLNDMVKMDAEYKYSVLTDMHDMPTFSASIIYNF